MILSASRRTDIPAFYADWFLRRVREGFVCVRNPMNPHQVSRISIRPEVTDCIVFWTKDPAPMLDRLDELRSYMYYFQFTLNDYPGAVEPRVPDVGKRLETFRALSRLLGRERVVWRYDPILLTRELDEEYHVRAFRRLAGELRDYTEKAVVSFVDVYPSRNRQALEALGMLQPPEEALRRLAARLAEAAREAGLEIAACAERMDLSDLGIVRNSCIDPALIERLIGCPLRVRPDGQRPDCGCVKCEEIGAYNTCRHGCVYCYANGWGTAPGEGCDPASPILCDVIDPEKDKVTDRPVKSLRLEAEPEQLSMF